MIKRILIGSAATVVTLATVAGVASAKPSVTKTNVNATVNFNSTNVLNVSNQFGVSGSAFVLGNTKGGDVKTGPVVNVNNTTTVVVTVNKTSN